ncbi:MAG: hypothetical protein WCA10_24615 [Terracidiphilus sp.]
MQTLDYAGVCIQARAVGGDYYDFLDLGSGRIAIVLADVSGKGMPAALLMAGQIMTNAVMAAEVGSDVVPFTSERRVLIVAWIITILLSSVPNILWQETMHRGTPWLFRGKLMLVLALLAFSAFVRLLRPLASHATVFLALLSLERLGQLTMDAPAFLRWFTSNWGRSMVGVQLIRLGATIALIAMVWLLVKKRRRAFLQMAVPDAQAQPVWYLPLRKPIAWSRLGPPMAFLIALGTLTFVLIAGRPDYARIRAAALPSIKELSMFSMLAEMAPSYRFPDGTRLVVIEKGPNNIDTFAINPDGTLGSVVVNHSVTPGVFDTVFTPSGALIVSENQPGGTDISSISSYTINADGTITAISQAFTPLATETAGMPSPRTANMSTSITREHRR